MLSVEQNQIVEDARERAGEEVADFLAGHEDWSANLMWFVLKMTLDGSSKQDIEGLVDFAKYCPRDDNGKIGRDSGYIYLYKDLVKLKEEHTDFTQDPMSFGKNVVSTHKESENPENSVLWEVLKFCYKGSGTRRLSYTRFNDSLNFIFALMSEGSEEVFGIIIKLHCRGINYIMGLDDMNIRGKQILYALEYCQGDFSILVSKITERDKNFVDYINYRSVEEAKKEGSFYCDRAVVSGASFKHSGRYFSQLNGINGDVGSLEIAFDDFDEYTYVEKYSPDYHSYSLDFDTPHTLGMKVLEANGFSVVYSSTLRVLGSKDKDKMLFLLFCNKDTGALCKVDGSTDDCFLYCGGDIMMLWTGERYPDFSMLNSCEVNNVEYSTDWGYEDNLWVCRIHLDTESMEAYKAAISKVKLHTNTIDMGYNNYNGIPFLSAYKVYSPDLKVFEKAGIGFMNLDRDGVSYYLKNCLNFLNTLSDTDRVASEFKYLYKPFIADKYRYFCEMLKTNLCGSWDVAVAVTGLAFMAAGVPEVEVAGYYRAVMKTLNIDRCKDLIKHLKKKGVKDFFGVYEEGSLLGKLAEVYGIDIVRGRSVPKGFNKTSKVDKSDAINNDKSEKKEILIAKFDSSLKLLKESISKCGCGSGFWMLYEDDGEVCLRGSDGRINVVKGTVTITGKLSIVPDEVWRSILRKALIDLTQRVGKPIKSIVFNVVPKSQEILITKSKKESGSYEVYLK